MSPSRVDEASSHCHPATAVELPILRDKPSYEKLRKALKTLELPPNSWNGQSFLASTNEAKSVSQYLLSIISSDLTWLDNAYVESEVADNQREELWELASRRIAERCGRSAMPEMTRTWIVPLSATMPEMKFSIREPPLTGDNLGLKTWGTAFTLVKKLEYLGSKYFDHLLNIRKASTVKMAAGRPQVLELGSGTGLVGISAGAIWGANVVLTDLPEIEDNLLFNIGQNLELVQSFGGSIQGEILDWKSSKGLAHHPLTEFEIIITADSLYDDEHPELVVRNIKRYLKPHETSRALVAIPMRDSHTRSMAEDFKMLMQEYSLELLHQGDEICHDDWAENEEESVKCWWGIWRPLCAS